MKAPGYILLLWLAGCAGTATEKTYMLTGAARPAEGSPHGQCIDLALHVPVMLDRPQLITNISPNEVEIHEGQRWASSLTDELTYALSRDIESRVGFLVAGPRSPCQDAETKMLIVDITRLEAVPGRQVLLEGRWRLGGAGNWNAQNEVNAYSTPLLGAAVDDIPPAIDIVVDQLAAAISADISR